MPGTDVTGGPPGASGFARDHLYRRDPNNGLGQVVYARLIAYQPSTLSFIDLTADASGNLNATGGGGGGGAVTIADGADVAQGAKADAAWVAGDGTVISLLKKIASAGGSAVSVADGADVAQGTTTDLSSANTVIGLLKNVKAALAGVLHVQVDSGLITADTELPAAASLADAEVNPTVPRVGSMGMLWNGATWDRAPGNAANGAKVQSAQLPASLGQKAMAASLAVVVASDQSAVPENLTQIAGTALAAKAVPANADGQVAIPVYVNSQQYATYDVGARGVVSGVLVAGTPKQLMSIEHALASTKTVRIRRIMVHMIQTTALSGAIDIQVTRGTAASSAGTGVTPVPRRSTDPAAEVVVKTLPTIVAGTIADNIPGGGFATTTTLYSPPVLVYDWQEAGETKPYMLVAGALQALVINVVSTAAHNLTLTISVDLTEE